MKVGSGSFDQFERRRADGRYRRILLVAAYSGEGAFTKPITAARFGGGSWLRLLGGRGGRRWARQRRGRFRNVVESGAVVP